MKREKLPLSVKFFKAKKLISDKKSDLKYRARKIKEHQGLKNFFYSIGKFIKILIKNLRENADNWCYRANADEGFLIDD
jgi:hypothetical protein